MNNRPIWRNEAYLTEETVWPGITVESHRRRNNVVSKILSHARRGIGDLFTASGGPATSTAHTTAFWSGYLGEPFGRLAGSMIDLCYQAGRIFGSTAEMETE